MPIVFKKCGNVFLKENKHLSKKEILAISNYHYLLKSPDISIKDFYKYKANKNGYAIASFSCLSLGCSIVYLAYTEGASNSEAIVVSSIFGGATIGFTAGWMINKIKFYKSKRKILKVLA
jgi:hypothetical protein